MATVGEWDVASLGDYTAVYPFLGTELLWFLVAVFFWLFFHARLVKIEKEKFAKISTATED